MSGIYHMFTGDDRQSHIEKMDPVSSDQPEFQEPATSIRFVTWPPGHFIDWHPAPRRQYIIMLSGQLELGLRDGTVWRFGPGDAWLVEDTTGQGHTTRVVGDTPHVMAAVALKAQ